MADDSPNNEAEQPQSAEQREEVEVHVDSRGKYFIILTGSHKCSFCPSIMEIDKYKFEKIDNKLPRESTFPRWTRSRRK